MSIVNLSWPAFMLGALLLAATLYLLQHLKTRYRPLVVASVRFWQQAIQDAPVRKLFKRFKHWLAYLLSLLICLLLWLGFATPEHKPASQQDFTVLYLDGSATAATDNVLDNAINALQADLVRLPSGQREVIWGGEQLLTLVAADDDAVLFSHQAKIQQPAITPSPLPALIRLLQTRFSATQPLQIWVYGNTPLPEADTLPANIRLLRRSVTPLSATNKGITAIGYSFAASGQPQALDVLISTTSTTGSPVTAAELEIRLDDTQLAADALQTVAPGQFMLRNLPASGGVISALLPEQDAFAADNTAMLQLPASTMINVAVSASVPAVISSAIQADSGLRLSNLEDAHVVVRFATDPFGAALPALELTDADATEQAFTVGITAAQQTTAISDTSLLQQLVQSLGLDLIDTTGLATALARPISLAVSESDQPYIGLWQQLLTPDYNLTTSQAFPVLVSKSLRYLAQPAPWYPFVSAGQPVWEDLGQFSLWPQQPLQTRYLNGTPVAGAAGDEPRSATALKVALAAPELSNGGYQPASAELQPQSVVTTPLTDVLMWLGLAVLLLLLTEWWCFQRGLMP